MKRIVCVFTGCLLAAAVAAAQGPPQVPVTTAVALQRNYARRFARELRDDAAPFGGDCVSRHRPAGAAIRIAGVTGGRVPCDADASAPELE